MTAMFVASDHNNNEWGPGRIPQEAQMLTLQAKQSESKGKPQAQECMRCGYNYHKQNEKCLEKNASCRRFNKIGHFVSVCKSSKVHSLEENYSSDDEEGLDQDMHLLRVTGLEVNGVNDSPATGENDECWESVQVNDHTLQC